MRFAVFVLVAFGLSGAGCGLTLDYAPPDQRHGSDRDGGLDAARPRDDGGAEHDVGLDAPTMEADAISVTDAIVPVDSTPRDAGLDAATRARGDCLSTSDCPRGTCVELVVGGYRVCRTPPLEATHCSGSSSDQCCTSSECPSGAHCFLGPVHPTCGGATMAPANECAMPECTRDLDCPSGICAAAGTLAPVPICLDAACRHDSDCTAEAGGTCVLARDPCCMLPVGLVCTYPSDGCVTNADCLSGNCAADLGRARCQPDPVVCPG